MAGHGPAAQACSTLGRDGRARDHDVSIRIVITGAVGLLRGVWPASNVSMMTIAEPQHGQGCAGFAVAVAAASSLGRCFGSGLAGVAAAINSRARASVSALALLRAKMCSGAGD